MPSEAPKSVRSTQQLSNNAVSDKQKVIVAVLLLGLIIAILTQPDSDRGEFATERESSVESKLAIVEQGKAEQEKAGVVEPESPPIDFADRRELPRQSIDAIENLVLFFPEPRPSPKASEVVRPETRQTPRVQAVYGTRAGHAALIDGAIVRAGHPLSNELRVSDVSDEGVELTRSTPSR